MTFQEWMQQNPKAIATFTITDLKLIEFGWMIAKLDAAEARLDDALEREAA